MNNDYSLVILQKRFCLLVFPFTTQQYFTLKDKTILFMVCLCIEIFNQHFTDQPFNWLLGCDEEFDDILQLICPLEINNNISFIEPFECSVSANEKLIEYAPCNNNENVEQLKTRKKPSHKNDTGNSKRGRPRMTPISDNLLRQRRDAANARERRRMNQMTRAYTILKEKLPNNEKIISKKQIVDQVDKLDHNYYHSS